MRDSLARLRLDVLGCRTCPRLVAWREEVARNPRAAYRGERYWARPIPAFGDPRAAVLVIGLAPAAHGANRTGRVFTGDESGRWLYRALFRAGFANQAESRRARDGLKLDGARVTSAVRCAPPGNRPSAEETDACAPFLERELALHARAAVLVVLGGFAWRSTLRALAAAGVALPRPLPRFGHAAEVALGPTAPYLLGSYHPSQLNTFTGRLTEPMLDAVFARARALADSRRPRTSTGARP